ncbi:HAD family hydrolase [Chloroflexota bacterium]
MAMKNIKVVSFDVEGTLTTTDFSYAIWFEAIHEVYAEKYKISLEEAKSIVINEFQKAENQGVESNDIDYWFSKFDLGNSQKIMFKYQSLVKQYPDVKEILSSLYKEYKLTIASSTTKNALGYLLKDIKPYFQKIFSSISDYQQLKTPEFYLKICQTMKLRPDQIAHIGDNWQYDYLAAREIGIHAFHLDRTGKTNKKESFTDLISIKTYLIEQSC